MLTKKRSWFLAALTGALLFGPSMVSADSFTSQRELLAPPRNEKDQPPLPEISDAEKSYLIHVARKALDFSAQTGKRYVAPDVPSSLRRMDYVAYVTCRSNGHMIGSIGGEGESLVENIARAAHHLATTERFSPPPTLPAGQVPPPEEPGLEKLAGAKATTIEVEVLGAGQEILYGMMKDVSNQIEPGIHGLAAKYKVTSDDPKKPVVKWHTVAFKPSVAPTHSYTSELVVRELVNKAGWVMPQVLVNKNRIRFYRYRGVHLLEWANREGYVELYRGAQLVLPNAITRDRLDMLIKLTAEYLLSRQLKDGLFSYEYAPAESRYSKGNNSTRQAAATWAVSRMGGATGDKRYELAVLKAIDTIHLQYLAPDRSAACVVYPELDTPPPDKNGVARPPVPGLGATALVLLAIVDLPQSEATQALAPLRDKLAKGIVIRQREDGSLPVHFSDDRDSNNKYYFPGEALLALMKTYNVTKNPQYLATVEKAFPYYKKLFETTESAAYKQSFAPWQTQAWELAWQATRKKEYLEFIWQMSDYVASFQADEASAPWADMVGGFINEKGFAGIGSATYLEGLVAAHRTAVASGDSARAAKYKRVLQLGARFIDQLTFKEADAFYCISKPDVIGGLKFSVYNHSIRIDNNQHAGLALIGIREQLFGKK